LAFPEEVRQAVQVSDGVAVEDHAKKIDGNLIAPATHLLATGPALTAFHHIVDGRSRGVRAGVIANGARTTDRHALTYQAHGSPGLLRGQEVERAGLVFPPPDRPQLLRVLKYSRTVSSVGMPCCIVPPRRWYGYRPPLYGASPGTSRRKGMPRVLFCVTMCGAVPGAKQPLDFTSPRHLSKSDNRDVARGSARQPWLQMCMG